MDRSEKSMDLFFPGSWDRAEMQVEIRLACAWNMWKAFRNSTLKPQNAPQAQIIYDKFHILKHLNEALDKVRKIKRVRPASRETGPESSSKASVHIAVPSEGQPDAGGASVVEGIVQGTTEG